MGGGLVQSEDALSHSHDRESVTHTHSSMHDENENDDKIKSEIKKAEDMLWM